MKVKEKVIKKVLNKKKSFATIFALVPPLAMLFIIVYSTVLVLNNSRINTENIATFKQIILIISIIAICWLTVAIYLLKFTNKLNVIKIPKEELEILYDKHMEKVDTDRIQGDFINTKEEYITNIFLSMIMEKNKELIQKNKQNENQIMFWLKEMILLIWCISFFNKETILMIKEDIWSGIVVVIILLIFPLFLFIKNIYTRYIKKE